MEFKLKMKIIAGVTILAVIGILVFAFSGGKSEDTAVSKTEATSSTIPKPLSTQNVNSLKPKTPSKPVINESENDPEETATGDTSSPLADSENTGNNQNHQNDTLNESSTVNTDTASTTGANKPDIEENEESLTSDEEVEVEQDETIVKEQASLHDSDKEDQVASVSEEKEEEEEKDKPMTNDVVNEKPTESGSVLIDAGLSQSKREIISIHQIKQTNDPDYDTFLFWIRKDSSGTAAKYWYFPIERLEAQIKYNIEPPQKEIIERAMISFESERLKSFANGRKYDVALLGEGFNISNGTGYASYLRYSEESIKQKMLEIASKPHKEMLAALKAYLFSGRLVKPVDWNKDNLKLSIVVKIPKAKQDASGADEEIVLESASVDAVQEPVDPAKVPRAEEANTANAAAESLIKDNETIIESEDDEQTTLAGRFGNDYYDESDHEDTNEPDTSVGDEQASDLNEGSIDTGDALERESSISINATDQDLVITGNHELEVVEAMSSQSEPAAPTDLIGKVTGYFTKNIFNPVSDYFYYDDDSDVSDDEDEYESESESDVEHDTQDIVSDSTLGQEDDDHKESDEPLDQDQNLYAKSLVDDGSTDIATGFIPQYAAWDAEIPNTPLHDDQYWTGANTSQGYLDHRHESDPLDNVSDENDPTPSLNEEAEEYDDESFGTVNFENWPSEELQADEGARSAVPLSSDSETDEEGEEDVQSSDNDEMATAKIETADSDEIETNGQHDELFDIYHPLDDEPIMQNAWNASKDHAQENEEEIFDYDSSVTGYEDVKVESDQEHEYETKQDAYDLPLDFAESKEDLDPAAKTVLNAEETSSETEDNIVNDEEVAQNALNQAQEELETEAEDGLDMARMFYPDSLDAEVHEAEVALHTDSEQDDDENAETASVNDYADEQQETLGKFDSQYIWDVPSSPYIYAAGGDPLYTTDYSSQAMDGSAANGYKSYSDQLQDSQNTFSFGAPSQDYLDITGKVQTVEENLVEQPKPGPEPNVPLKSDEPIASDNLFEYELLGAEQYAKGGSEAKYKAAYKIIKSSRYKEAYLFTLYKQLKTDKIEPEAITDMNRVLVPTEVLVENIKSSVLNDSDDERFQVITANSKTYFVYLSGTGFNYGYTYAGIANELIKYLSECSKEDIYAKFIAYTNSGRFKTPFHLNNPDVQILITVQ